MKDFHEDECSSFLVRPDERIVEARTVTVRLGGKRFTVHALVTERSIRRGRRWRSAHVEVPGGMAIPGKGENAFDCGDDAVFGLYCKASSVREAVKKLVEDVRETRRRRGGARWKPALRRRRRARKPMKLADLVDPEALRKACE